MLNRPAPPHRKGDERADPGVFATAVAWPAAERPWRAAGRVVVAAVLGQGLARKVHFGTLAHCGYNVACATTPGSVPEEEAKRKKLAMITRQIRSWRFRNRLSQRAAVEVMRERGRLDVTLAALKAWEQGRNEPRGLAVNALRLFLTTHKRVENPPIYKPGPKPGRK